jgi:hypothetical protein
MHLFPTLSVRSWRGSVVVPDLHLHWQSPTGLPCRVFLDLHSHSAWCVNLSFHNFPTSSSQAVLSLVLVCLVSLC